MVPPLGLGFAICQPCYLGQLAPLSALPFPPLLNGSDDRPHDPPPLVALKVSEVMRVYNVYHAVPGRCVDKVLAEECLH